MSLKFQSQPNRWSCSVASAAMVMNVPLHDLVARIGHDGGEIVFPDLPEPKCRAGFTMDEIIDAAFEMGWAITPMVANPVPTPDGTNERTLWDEEKVKARMSAYFDNFSGTVFGLRYDFRNYHNVAWCHERQMWLDPSGPQLPRDKPPMQIETFWIFSETFWIFSKIDRILAQTFLDSIIKKGK